VITNQRLLIVHADDFGITEAISDGIVLAHKEGILTSTSVMATSEAFVHAMRSYQSVPSLDLGVHLTLVGEVPVLEAGRIPSLVDRDGRLFSHAATFTKKYLMGKIVLEEVREECDAQIRMVQDWNVPISHLDSHQHLHALPAIRRVVVGLAQKYNIPAVRLPHEKPRRYMFTNYRMAPRALQMLALSLFCRMGGRSKIVQTDHFAGFYFSGRLTRRNLRTLIDNLPVRGACELVCHPGLAANNVEQDHWNYCWRDELDALIDPDLPDILRQRGIGLINYRDLASLRQKT
jgi:hopanoid biosynthesis associated protein HpnK